MYKKLRWGLFALLVLYGGVSMAEPTPTSQDCFEFNTGTNTITKYKFWDSSCPRDIVIPEIITVDGIGYEVRELGLSSFSDVPYLDWVYSVIIPSTIKKIGENAFAGQNLLHTVELSEGLEEIGSGAFYAWTNSGGTTNCFGENTIKWSLKSVIFPSTLKKIGYVSFSCQSLTWLILPDSVIEMGGEHLWEIN